MGEARILLLAGQGGQPSGSAQAGLWRAILERRGAVVAEARLPRRGRHAHFSCPGGRAAFHVVVSSCGSHEDTVEKLGLCGVAPELYAGARIVRGGKWWGEIIKLDDSRGCALLPAVMERVTLPAPQSVKRKAVEACSQSRGAAAAVSTAKPSPYHPTHNPWSLVPEDFAPGGRACMPCLRPSIIDNPNAKLCMMVKELLAMVKNSSEDQILLATGTRRSQEKVTAYGRLLSVLRAWPKRLTLANVHELKQAKYVGRSGFLKVKEGLEDMLKHPDKPYPTCSKLELFRNHPDSHLTRIARELSKVHGVGRATALRWFKDYGIQNLDQLRTAARTRETPLGHRFEKDGVDEKDDDHPMSQATRVCLAHLDQILMPMREEERDYFFHLLPSTFTGFRLKRAIVGGMRRIKPGQPCNKHHDLDILISLDATHESVTEQVAKQFKPRECMDFLLSELAEHIAFNLSLTGGRSDSRVDTDQHHVRFLLMRNREGEVRRVDLVVVPTGHWAFALLGWSGSTQFERSIKDYTKNMYRGPKEDVAHSKALIEGHLRFCLTNSTLALVTKRPDAEVEEFDIVQRYDHCKTEQDIFEVLGLRYLEPWQRCC